MDSLPDPGSLTLADLKRRLKELTDKELTISFERRGLQTQIDVLRGELVRRLREGGQDVISGSDPDPGFGPVSESREGLGQDRARIPSNCQSRLTPALDGPLVGSEQSAGLIDTGKAALIRDEATRPLTPPRWSATIVA